MLNSVHSLNRAFVPVLDQLVCYKTEVGTLLQRLVEAYNMIILDQFESYYRNED